MEREIKGEDIDNVSILEERDGSFYSIRIAIHLNDGEVIFFEKEE